MYEYRGYTYSRGRKAAETGDERVKERGGRISSFERSVGGGSTVMEKEERCREREVKERRRERRI